MRAKHVGLAVTLRTVRDEHIAVELRLALVEQTGRHVQHLSLARVKRMVHELESSRADTLSF